MDTHSYSEFVRQIDQMFGTSKVIISKDCAYHKKFNLSEDPSNWDGWRIEAIMTAPKKMKIIFINLRRKYIPPFFETYSDFSFFCCQDLVEFNDNELIEY